MTKITLTREITVSGEPIIELTLREPTYDEMASCGIPFTITEDGEVKMDLKSTLRYLPILAGIPPSSAKQMTPKDIMTASMSIVSFFTASAV
ncbi:phage tail assembly protein [Serratia sp. UGAL515B_01]|uniref:phage tail assembly protein n=1 Tax=Serratia sp. UGAL515B_01 TaxID=2986763 RepID=UPI002955629A|nr:phage tail assembly protein [Serratia sp. UGAL515B_01]WON77837.1 phage tail assembly protein [Serratia sp. UGAL515B_01]